MAILNKRDKAVIFVIDDDFDSLRLLEAMLQKAGYETRCLPSAKSALKLSQRITPGLVLLDMNMPDMNGLMFARAFKQQANTRNVPIIFISGQTHLSDKVKAFQHGAVDYITKPYECTEVLVRLRNHLELSRARQQLLHYGQKLETVNGNLQKINQRSQEEMLHRLAMIAEKHDDLTGEHMNRVGEYSYLLAKQLGFTEKDAKMLRQAAPLHDIGKIAIRDSILLKPGKLTDEEFEIIKSHAAIGAEMLSESVSPAMNLAESVALSHHEKWNGAGYPNGLAGDNIPLCGRIVAVVDAYDAMMQKRPYKAAWSKQQTLTELRRCSGSYYDPDVVKAFFTLHAKIPQIKHTELLV